MSNDIVRHMLSFAVRFDNHFNGEPVPEELPVRLAGSFIRPAARPGGGGYRQADGTYRFVNLPSGRHRLLWRAPFSFGQAGWMRWYDPVPEVTLPLVDPTQSLRFQLWPAAGATAPTGAAGVRGKLKGVDVAGLEVRLVLQGQPFAHFTCCDDAGEFLFLLGGRLPVNAAGRVPLAMAVRRSDGAPRILAGGSFLPGSAGSAFGADQFEILPGQVARILFNLS